MGGSWGKEKPKNRGSQKGGLVIQENDKEPLMDELGTHKGSSKLRNRHHHTLFQKEKFESFESLNYKLADNLTLREHYKTSNIRRLDVFRLAAKWGIYLVIGAVMGLVAFVVRTAVDGLQELRLSAVKHFLGIGSPALSFVVYWAINLGYVLIATIMVFLFGPMVAGGGIPEIKGYLNGVRVVGALNLKTFVGKTISIIFSYASCLSLGPEGPMVHIGSAVGAGVSAAKSRTLRFRLPKIFDRLRGDREQRDFVSSGAAAGIAAAFGAPIGGVLFALEDVSTHWSRELTWRSFFGCMISALTVNLIYLGPQTGSGLLINDYGILTFGLSRRFLYRYPELLAFILLGIIGGLLGALFTKMNIAINKWRRQYISKWKLRQFIEVLAVTTITACLAFGLSVLIPCRPVSEIEYFDNVCDNVKANSTVPENIFCSSDDYFNDLANLLVISEEHALKLLFSRTENMFKLGTLGIYLGVYFVLVCVTSGIALAAGLFLPMMVVGATYGRMVGIVVQMIFHTANPPIDTSIYALVGSAAMMAGFSRITISLCVIMMEITETTQYLLPTMLAVMTAKWVGDALTPALYEEIAQLKSIPIMEFHTPLFTYMEEVKEMMSTDVMCLREREDLEVVTNAIEGTKHSGWPVVREEGEDRKKTYVGYINRKQLLLLLEQQTYYMKTEPHPPGMMDYEYYLQQLNMNRDYHDFNLPPPANRKNFWIDLSPYMDRSHITISPSFSFIEAYKLFMTLSLRHLIVCDNFHQVVGIISRHDLLKYHFENETHEIPLDAEQ